MPNENVMKLSNQSVIVNNVTEMRWKEEKVAGFLQKILPSPLSTLHLSSPASPRAYLRLSPLTPSQRPSPPN